VTRPNTRAIILKSSTYLREYCTDLYLILYIEVAISFFGRPALGDFSAHKARQPLKFVVAWAALQN